MEMSADDDYTEGSNMPYVLGNETKFVLLTVPDGWRDFGNKRKTFTCLSAIIFKPCN
jgi:hypothetical protein